MERVRGRESRGGRCINEEEEESQRSSELKKREDSTHLVTHFHSFPSCFFNPFASASVDAQMCKTRSPATGGE